MTILADAMIALPADRLAAGGLRLKAEFLRAREHLCLPWDGNHTVLPHPSLGQIYAQEAQDKAARFVFDERVMMSAESCIKDPESMEAALMHARPPVNRGWFEFHFPSTGIRQAIFFEQSPALALDGLFILGSSSCSPVPVAAFSGWNIREDLPHFEFEDRRVFGLDECWTWIKCFVVACTFLNIHRAVTVAPVSASAKLQAARRRRGKAPFLSFNRVSLNLPKAELSRGSRQDRGAAGVRFHQVIGHLRLLKEGRLQPVFVWVQPHWRGDPRLGTVLRELDVKVA